MSVFSIGKNEVKELQQRRREIEDILKREGKNNSVLSLRQASLIKEQRKLDRKLSILKYMNPENFNDDSNNNNDDGDGIA